MRKKLRGESEVLSPSGIGRALGAARAGRSQMGGGRVGPETTMKMRIIIIMILRIIIMKSMLMMMLRIIIIMKVRITMIMR